MSAMQVNPERHGHESDLDLEWMKRRVLKASIPGSVAHWPEQWARAYVEDVSALVAEVERLRSHAERRLRSLLRANR